MPYMWNVAKKEKKIPRWVLFFPKPIRIRQ